MNEIVKSNNVIQPVQMETITEYLDTTGLTKQLLPKEKAMFINMAKEYGLNPFKRELYCTVYGEGKFRQCSIVTGYEVYIKRAERIGRLDGWDIQAEGTIKNGDLRATITIYRKDWSHPFRHTVYYNECVQRSGKTGEPNAVWKKMPIFMTKKVAVAQAFRLCFPDEFGGMPYTNDEMGVDEIKEVEVAKADVEVKNVQTEKKPVQQPKAENVEVVTVEETTDDSTIQDLSIQLENMVQEYRFELQGQPYKLATQTLNKKGVTEKELTEMIARVITYLSKKGIKV